MNTNEQKNYTIKEMPIEERPREKLISYGESRLSNSELIAILLGSGIKGRTALELAADLLYKTGGLNHLSDQSINELSLVKGIGTSRAARLIAAFEIGRRVVDFTPGDKVLFKSPVQVADYLRPRLSSLKQEVFLAVMLDIKSQVIKIEEISRGGLSRSIVHPREVFKAAVKASAAGIIVGHNHPSGNPSPSPEDINITKKLIEAGDIMGIKLLDHIIIGDNKYLSLREEGLIEWDKT